MHHIILCAWPQSCGTGMQKKRRSVSVPAAFGGGACPALSHFRQCQLQPCPVDCGVAFGAWTPCSKSCGTGVRSRQGTVAHAPAHGGKACDPAGLLQVDTCTLRTCGCSNVYCKVETHPSRGPFVRVFHHNEELWQQHHCKADASTGECGCQCSD